MYARQQPLGNRAERCYANELRIQSSVDLLGGSSLSLQERSLKVPRPNFVLGALPP